MCGIVGFFDLAKRYSADRSLEIMKVMSEKLFNRGPDDSGTWIDSMDHVTLGHRRLSVIDLSPQGRQPMLSSTGRYVIVYNGEIYNYQKIRLEQEANGYSFSGSSDTDVLLNTIEQTGLFETLSRLVGMFAFGLWDREQKKLHLVRDRIGIKPLYYGWAGKNFLFGSSLQALRAHPQFEKKINNEAVALMLRYGSVPAPLSIYENIFKLLPGSVLTVSHLELEKKESGVVVPYWSPESIVRQGIESPFEGNDEDAIDTLEDLLKDAIAQRMIADVPLGAFLSGGVDSSTVVALMQAQATNPVKTFTIGFQEQAYNEAKYAKDVARHLGTDHHELYVTPQDTLSVIPKLPLLYDEPFSDSSQIPTYLVSKLARTKVTVALSGDGGDELFGGYNRHIWGPRIWKRFGSVPFSLRKAGSAAINLISPVTWNKIAYSAQSLFPNIDLPRAPGDKLYKIASVLESPTSQQVYEQLVSHWGNSEVLALKSLEQQKKTVDQGSSFEFKDMSEMMMYRDLVSYLPNDILTKLDRASMGVSLEARVPILDHRVVEFSWKLSGKSMRIRNGTGKWLLRQVLHRYVPMSLIERPKVGFGVPLDHWLRGPLREWAESLIEESRLEREGFFDPKIVREKWNSHLSKSQNLQHQLWDILMFQAWLEAN